MKCAAPLPNQFQSNKGVTVMYRHLVLTLVLTLTLLGGSAAQASPVTYTAVLSGAAESSPGTGFAPSLPRSSS